MTDTLSLIANHLLGWTVITLALSWVLALGYPLFSQSLRKYPVETVANFTLVYGLLAPIIATTAIILLAVPALAFSFISDHCHGSNCTPHTLYITTETAEGIIAVLMAVLLLMAVFSFMLIQLFSGRRQLRLLHHLSNKHTNAYSVVDSEAPVAWCAGLLKPQVYLSSGLINALTPRQFNIVLAHELAHAIRKDNLRKWILHWATIAWPTSRKRTIRRDLAYTNEQVCDLAAARINNNTLDKETLIATFLAYNSTSGHNNASDTSLYQQRLSSFDLASRLQTNKAISTLKPTGIIASIWLTTAVLALHLGHPLLERLSQ